MTTNKDLAIQNIEKEFENLSNLILEQLHFLDELFENKNEASTGEPFVRLTKMSRKLINMRSGWTRTLSRPLCFINPWPGI